jgi:hypothetical protein
MFPNTSREEVTEWFKAAACEGCHAAKSHRRFASFASPGNNWNCEVLLLGSKYGS